MLLKLWSWHPKLYILSIWLLVQTGMGYFHRAKYSLVFLFLILILYISVDFEIIFNADLSSQEAVVKRGEELIKKKASGVNLEDANLISRLFVLFNGKRHF